MSDNVMGKTAILLGATGLIGGHCLQFLLKSPRYSKVICLLRKKLPIINDKLEQVIVDFDHLQSHADALKGDDVFCCLGTTIKVAKTKENFRKVDYQYPLEAGKIALANGATQYLLVSSLGASSSSMVFYSKTKGEVERDLKALGYPTLHILQPSLLLGDRSETRLGEQVGEAVMTSLSFLMQGPLKKYRAIESEAVAFALVYLASQHQDGTHTHQSDAIQAIYDKHGKA